MVRLTFGLLSKILKIFDYDGEILIYWNYTCIKTICEDTEIEDLEDLPEDCDVGDFYVKFPGYDEMDFDKAFDLIKGWEVGNEK